MKVRDLLNRLARHITRTTQYYNILKWNIVPLIKIRSITLITAGMNDTRVIVWQPAKFAARLQALNASGKPILLKINYGAGHGIGDTKMVHYEDIADKLIFTFWQTGHTKFQF